MLLYLDHQEVDLEYCHLLCHLYCCLHYDKGESLLEGKKGIHKDNVGKKAVYRWCSDNRGKTTYSDWSFGIGNM
jgi:hypothetical protein